MQKDDKQLGVTGKTGVTGNLVQPPATSGDGMNRQQRRAHEQKRLTVNGFKVAVGTLKEYLEGIKAHLEQTVLAGDATAEEMEPAIDSINDHLLQYHDVLNWKGVKGAVPPGRLYRKKKLADLFESFDKFMKEIEDAKDEQGEE